MSTRPVRTRATAAGTFMRLTTETKQAFFTTEFWMTVLIIVATLIACWVIDDNGDGIDAFPGVRAWLYVAIVASAYIISRGLAKSGSHEPYWADREDIPGISEDK